MYYDRAQNEVKCTARLISPAAVDWLGQRSEIRVLHVFQNSCNLINPEGSILSLVSAEIGPGPFAITVEKTHSPNGYVKKIWEDVTTYSRVKISLEKIQLATALIDLSEAQIWNPRPAWEAILYCNWEHVHPTLRQLLLSHSHLSNVIHNLNGGRLGAFGSKLMQAQWVLSTGIQENDIVKAKAGAVKMAGLGSGLTPAGDDFLMGFIYSLWSRWDSKRANDWAMALVESAVPLTTHLSAAWLKAAANGEAAEPWHRLVNALIDDKPGKLVDATVRILATGHSSGTDALSGYVSGIEVLSSVQSS